MNKNDFRKRIENLAWYCVNKETMHGRVKEDDKRL